MHELIVRNRTFFVTGLLILFSILFLGFFPVSEKVSPVFQGVVVSIFFFLAVPVLYSKMILKESLNNIGWHKGNMLAGSLIGVACVGIGMIIVFSLSRMFPMREQYVFSTLVERSFLWFMAYELIIVSCTVFLYEVFFRGLVQLSWLRNVGALAIFFQALLFWALFYLSGDFTWQKAPLLIFAPLSGLIAYYSRSIWYSFAAAWLFLFLVDVFFLATVN